MQVPDVGKVLERADRRWASRRPDEPADTEYLAALALAVQQQVVDQLTTAPVVDDTEVRLLRADNASLADQLEQLRRELSTKDADLDTARDELRRALSKPHKHFYEFTGADRPLSECSCGLAYPRAAMPKPPAEPAPKPEPFEALLDRVRGELQGWPA
jgi:hypothetical protein